MNDEPTILPIRSLTMNGSKYQIRGGIETLSCAGITLSGDQNSVVNLSALFGDENPYLKKLTGQTFNLATIEGTNKALSAIITILGGIALAADSGDPKLTSGQVAQSLGLDQTTSDWKDVAAATGKAFSDEQTVGDYMSSL